jgi:hypothetical protein
MSLDPDQVAERAGDHAWDWFALHAAQRMQSFNYFLVATAFLFAAYANLFEKHPDASTVVALMGAWLGFWFNLIDHRSRQLLKAGERALAVSEERLATLANMDEIELVKAVERPVGRFDPTYGKSISFIQISVIIVFLAAAAYAIHAWAPWAGPAPIL